MRTEQEIKQRISEMEDMKTLVAYSFSKEISLLKWVLGEG